MAKDQSSQYEDERTLSVGRPGVLLRAVLDLEVDGRLTGS
jgi:hypothetical protein